MLTEQKSAKKERLTTFCEDNSRVQQMHVVVIRRTVTTL